jgi:hypothetical protein
MANITHTTSVHIGHHRVISCVSGTYVLVERMKDFARHFFMPVSMRIIIIVMMMGGVSTVAWAAVNPMEKLEGLVMPGDVAQGHARFETKCDKCHEPFKKENQSKLCRECHEQIDNDIKKKKGFHGKLHNIRERECHTCHTDHKGRDMDIIQLDSEVFTLRNKVLPIKVSDMTTRSLSKCRPSSCRLI